DPASARVALLFRAQPGPLTGVEFQGARIGHGLRATVEGLLRDGGLKADSLEEAIDVLEKAFHRQGYRDATVSRRQETRGPREVVPYRIRDLARDRNALLIAYRDAGYAQVEVKPEAALSEDRQQADVVLHVIAGPRLSVDHVVVAGLERTEEQVVRREMAVKE